MMRISGILPDVSVVLPAAGSCVSPEGRHYGSFFDATCFLFPGISKVRFCLPMCLFSAFRYLRVLHNLINAVRFISASVHR